MKERLRFVAPLLEGEGMSNVRPEFGASRKSGYESYNRYKEDANIQEQHGILSARQDLQPEGNLQRPRFDHTQPLLPAGHRVNGRRRPQTNDSGGNDGLN